MTKPIAALAISLALLTACTLDVRDHVAMSFYDHPNADLRLEGLDELRGSLTKVDLPLPFKQVWTSALAVLAQHATVYEISRNHSSSGAISYVDVDVLVFDEEPFTMDMPFILLIEEGTGQKTTVYVHPRFELAEKKIADRFRVEQIAVVRNAMASRGQLLLYRVVNQSLAGQRWGWLQTK